MRGGRPEAAAVQSYVGQSLLRVEDRPLLTGAGCFVDDLRRDGQVFARIVRSEVAHGRIVSISASASTGRPGVLAVITAADVPDLRIPVRMMPSEEAELVTQPPLARDVVRYVGEPLAVVVARDPYVAEDAAGAVEVEIAPMKATVNALEAIAPQASVLHEGASGNVVNRLSSTWGEDVDALLAGADAVVRDRLRVQRHAAIPLEPRGLVAEFDPSGPRLTVWGPTKVKHFNRTLLAGFLDMPEEQIRLVEPDIGGGFGARGEFYPEDFLVPWLAIELGRPVKWVEDRREHFLAANHSREVWCDLELGATAGGRLLAFRARAWVDQGAYARTHGTMLLPWILLHHLPGPYVWQGFDIEASSVLTNKTPSGTYRAPSQYEATFLRERMIDRVARQIGVGPAELREDNLVPLEAMPYTMDLGEVNRPIVYDGGDFPELLRTLRSRPAPAALSGELARRRRRGELMGVGLSAFVEEAAFGRYEYARVVPGADGGYIAYVGIAALGQGVRTALAQVLADELHVPVDRVEISHRDTELVPEGFGSYASRATVMGGGAVIGAARDLRHKAIAAGSELMEISERDVVLAPSGVIHPRGNPGRGIPLAELGCEGVCRYERAGPGFDMGAVLAHVAVEETTGRVTVVGLSVCQDVGRVVNPQLVDGQLVGAAAQGIGGALFEELAYEESGQPLVTSFMDYLMPTAAEIPAIQALALELPHHDPATETPLGLKGCGEGGLVGTGAAIANAVADALGHRGDRLTRLPLSPGAVLGLLHEVGAPPPAMTAERGGG